MTNSGAGNAPVLGVRARPCHPRAPAPAGPLLAVRAGRGAPCSTIHTADGRLTPRPLVKRARDRESGAFRAGPAPLHPGQPHDIRFGTVVRR
ncbi:hypothetical protein ACWDFL_04910 [Streptomyces bungoensis]